MISIIAAIGQNNELGIDNKLIWHLKKDLENFKKLTLGKKIVMGANTYYSLPQKLVDREYIVLSTKINNISNGQVFHNFENLLNYLNNLNEEVMIIGGKKIYELFLPYAERLYLTEIKANSRADVYFPKFAKNFYHRQVLKMVNDEEVNYEIVLYERRLKMQGKLIVIEGTDCSGKETQTKKLITRLTQEGYKVFPFTFPKYDSPTGKIVGGPYLGKEAICEGWFKEGAPQVDALVSCCYYAADRRYNMPIILNHLNAGDIVIIDRYVESNMAHQGGKLATSEERLNLFKKIEKLEYDVLELPRPDAIIFLYMPYEYATILKQNRQEAPDENESDEQHLRNAEATYLELCDLYNFAKVDCFDENGIKSIDNIHKEVYTRVRKILEKK